MTVITAYLLGLATLPAGATSGPGTIFTVDIPLDHCTFP